MKHLFFTVLTAATLLSSFVFASTDCKVQKVSDKKSSFFNYVQFDTIYEGPVSVADYLIVKDDGLVVTKSILQTSVKDLVSAAAFEVRSENNSRAVEIALMESGAGTSADDLTNTISAGGFGTASIAIRTKGIVVSCTIK